jgi:hypothetical protein
VNFKAAEIQFDSEFTKACGWKSLARSKRRVLGLAVLSAHQQVTREWWSARSAFELFVSQFVVDEPAAGDGDAACKWIKAWQN